MENRLELVPSWLPASHGSREELATTAQLRISLGDIVATRVDDGWARAVRDDIRVSCYPLALWLASSWWRVRWEAASASGRQSESWQMAHQTAAIGGGYLWPRLTFLTDGEFIELVSQQSNRILAEPIRFLSDARMSMAAPVVERGLAEFIDTVVARLDSEGVKESVLHRLWREVEEERQDEPAGHRRRLEAQLGFEPDEAPEPLLDEWVAAEAKVGREATLEVANVRAARPEERLRQVLGLASGQGITSTPDQQLASLRPFALKSAGLPWERGAALATECRKLLGLNGHMVTDAALGDALGLKLATIAPNTKAPVSLGVRQILPGQLKLFFRRWNPLDRRFEAARFVADFVLASEDEQWLPSTDMATARQKIQRAFAAEFLAPIVQLADRLGGDFSAEAIQDAAAHFQVQPLAVFSHLANHGLISPDAVRI